MRLTAEEEALLAGRWGEPARQALEMQIATGEFFGAARLVPVTSAHLTGDPQSMGDAGLAFVEELVRQGRASSSPPLPTPATWTSPSTASLASLRRSHRRSGGFHSFLDIH